MDGVTLHMYARQMPELERNEIFQHAQNRTALQRNTAWKLFDKIEAEEQMTALSRVIRETQRTKEKFIYCAVFIELIADTYEGLQNKQIEVQSLLSRHKIIVDRLRLRQLSAYNTVKPNGKTASARNLSAFILQAVSRISIPSPTPANPIRTASISAAIRTEAISSWTSTNAPAIKQTVIS